MFGYQIKKYAVCLIIVICSIVIVGVTPLLAEIDQQVVTELQSITQKVLQFKTYKYKLTSITYKKRKERKNVMLYHFGQPKKIRIEWLDPKKLRGQLAVYNDGIMKAAPSWLPFVVEVNPDSALGMADFNYPIYKSTMGDLMTKVVDELSIAHTVRILGKTDSDIIYEVINDQNRAKIKVNAATGIPLFIEQYDLKGKLVDGGYFDDFQSDVSYSDGFFEL